MAYRLFYKPVMFTLTLLVRMTSALVIIAGDLRTPGHGKTEYMQGRVFADLGRRM